MNWVVKIMFMGKKLNIKLQTQTAGSWTKLLVNFIYSWISTPISQENFKRKVFKENILQLWRLLKK